MNVKTNGFVFLLLVVCSLVTTIGCRFVDQTDWSQRYHVTKKIDSIRLGRDHVRTRNAPILQIAKSITQFEDGLRQDGTITTKTPDVWTDSNLMHSIQEFDREMESELGAFTETIQAFLAESDRVGTLSDFAGGTTGPLTTITETTADSKLTTENKTSTPTPELAPVASKLSVFQNAAALDVLTKAVTASKDMELQLEPTERLRQHATYLNVNQSLRRRKMGGDNTRRPGYGLYLFRIPVSVLPGEETSRGYSAHASFRAQLQVTPADVKYTFPRMAISELVDKIAEGVQENWTTKRKSETKTSHVINQLKRFHVSMFQDQPMFETMSRVVPGFGSSRNTQFEETTNPISRVIPSMLPLESTLPAAAVDQTTSFPVSNSGGKFNDEDILAVRDYVQSKSKHLDPDVKPDIHDLRDAMFNSFLQISIHMQELKAFDIQMRTDLGNVPSIKFAARQLEIGESTAFVAEDWINQFKLLAPHLDDQVDEKDRKTDELYLNTAWLIARHCGLTGLNIRRLLQQMQLRQDVSQDLVNEAESINFFSDNDLDRAAIVWKQLIEEEFPLQVFNLEPVIEEQNLLDSQSRLRQMQVALAYSVANGGWGVRQRVELARELARDSAAIGVNRTSVGFVHGMDTFGWNFYPRTQSPDRLLMGPLMSSLYPQTRIEDSSTYRLEPGIRECEVLIAMPSFVSRVSFDVTTNWERLSKPGRSKRSYEELIAKGCELTQLKNCLNNTQCAAECRPGDMARLASRVEQLEEMLGMQTHIVDVPYDYDHQSGELFNEGERSLKPEVYGYHGLTQLVANEKVGDAIVPVTAEFFITGRNFHPTLTHVIVGGHESHTLGDEAGVEILNRELIRVKVGLKTDKLSPGGFEVRVGTPSGMSSSLVIKAPAKEPDKEPVASLFDWDSVPKFEYYTYYPTDSNTTAHAVLKTVSEEAMYNLKLSSKNPLSLEQLRSIHATKNSVRLKMQYEVTFEDKSTKPYKLAPFRSLTLTNNSVGVSHATLFSWIKEDLGNAIHLPESKKATIKVTSYLSIDDWPVEALDKTFEVKLIPPQPWKQDAVSPTAAPAATPSTNSKGTTPAINGTSTPAAQSGVGMIIRTQ